MTAKSKVSAAEFVPPGATAVVGTVRANPDFKHQIPEVGTWRNVQEEPEKKPAAAKHTKSHTPAASAEKKEG